MITRFICSRSAANFAATSATVSTLQPPITPVQFRQIPLKPAPRKRALSGECGEIIRVEQDTYLRLQLRAAQARLRGHRLKKILVVQRQRLMRLQRAVVQRRKRPDKVDGLRARFLVVIFRRTDGCARARTPAARPRPSRSAPRPNPSAAAIP